MTFKFNESRIDDVGVIEAFRELALILDKVTELPIYTGSGSPESVVSAGIGSLFLRTDGGASTTLYVKESGTGTTGWVAK